MDSAKFHPLKRWPILFCCATVTPIFAIFILGEFIIRFLPSPPHLRLTVDNVTFFFVTAEILVSFGFVIGGWVRGERPRVLALLPIVANVWVLHYVFVTSNQPLQPTADRLENYKVEIRK